MARAKAKPDESPQADEIVKGVTHAFRWGRMTPDQAAPAPVDDLSTRWLKPLERALSLAARVPVAVAAGPVSRMTLAEHRTQSGAMPATAALHWDNDAGVMLLAAETRLVGALVDHFYGGCGKGAARRSARLTRGEAAHFALFLTTFLKTLRGAGVKGADAGAVTALACNDDAMPVSEDMAMAFCRFDVAIAGVGVGYIDLATEIAATDAVASPQKSDPAAHHSDDWHRDLMRRLAEVRLPARSVLAQPSIALSRLSRLRRGDIIPIATPRYVPLIVGSRRFASGSIGEQGGHAAFQIETLEQEVHP